MPVLDWSAAGAIVQHGVMERKERDRLQRSEVHCRYVVVAGVPRVCWEVSILYAVVALVESGAKQGLEAARARAGLVAVGEEQSGMVGGGCRQPVRVLAIANLRMESLSPWHPSPWPWTRSWPTDFLGVQFGEARWRP